MSDDGTITVETTGDFMLLDPLTQEIVSAHGSSTVPMSQFIADKLTSGDLRAIEDAPAEPAAKKSATAKDK